MREDLTYKAYLQYYRTRNRFKHVFDVFTKMFAYIALAFITIGMKIIRFFVIGFFIGLGVAMGLWLVRHRGLG